MQQKEKSMINSFLRTRFVCRYMVESLEYHKSSSTLVGVRATLGPSRTTATRKYIVLQLIAMANQATIGAKHNGVNKNS